MVPPRINERGEIIGADRQNEPRLMSQTDNIVQVRNIQTAALANQKSGFKNKTMIWSAIIYGLLGSMYGYDQSPEGLFIGLIIGVVGGLGATAVYNNNYAKKYGGIEYVWSLICPLGLLVALTIGFAVVVVIILFFILSMFLS